MKRTHFLRLTYWLSAVSLLTIAYAPVYNVTAGQNLCSLPVNRRAGVVYRQSVGKRVIPFEGLFMVARAWMRDYSADYSLEQEQPLLKKSLLCHAIILPSRIDPENIKYRLKSRVGFWITVDAERDTFSVFLFNYRVHGIRESHIYIEKVLHPHCC